MISDIGLAKSPIRGGYRGLGNNRWGQGARPCHITGLHAESYFHKSVEEEHITPKSQPRNVAETSTEDPDALLVNWNLLKPNLHHRPGP